MISRLRGGGGGGGGGGSLLSSGCTLARRMFVGSSLAQAHSPPMNRAAAAVAAAAVGVDGFGARRNFSACHGSTTSWERRTGSVRSYSTESGGSISGGVDASVFGVVQIGASQFKVSPDDLIFVEKLSEYQVNDKVCALSAADRRHPIPQVPFQRGKRFIY